MYEEQKFSRGATAGIKGIILHYVGALNDIADDLEDLVYSSKETEKILTDTTSLLGILKEQNTAVLEAATTLLDIARNDSNTQKDETQE